MHTMEAHAEKAEPVNDKTNTSRVQAHIVPIQQEATEDVRHVDLSWRSWLVVFVTCFAYVFQMAVHMSLTENFPASWPKYLWLSQLVQ